MLSLGNKLLLAASILLFFTSTTHPITTLLKSDPYPVFTSLDPQTFLYTRTKLILKGYDIMPAKPEKAGIFISPFGQNANLGETIYGEVTQLGDLDTGRWNMITLLFGDVPAGRSLGPALEAAKMALFPNGVGLNDPNLVDPDKIFGFFSFPLLYRKRGVRFEVDAMLGGDFGMSLQTGIVDITQTVTATINLTNTCQCASFPSGSCMTQLSTCDVNKYLMDPLKTIAQQINLDICDFHKVSIEEVRLNFFWRHAMPINLHEEEWPEFLLIPYAQLTGSISPGFGKDANKAFGVPFGNNRHYAIGFNSGINIDFFDTVEIGGEFGYTHFFKRDCVELRVPTSIYQTGIFPFSTTVDWWPGDNWNFGAKISAYHFLDRLSAYFQWQLVIHKKDTIRLVNPDPAFHPEVLECLSDWKVQVGNFGLNYDISPNIGLGFLWQMPLKQRRVYRSTTLMFSFNVVF